MQIIGRHRFALVLPQALTYKVWCRIHRNPQETRQKSVAERVIGQTELTYSIEPGYQYARNLPLKGDYLAYVL